MPGRLKMEEIATLTGYSVSTVSRVLSGKSYASDKAVTRSFAPRAN
ncbi:ribose operon repressor [Enterobacter cloacae]|uniref:Ribose operon repressor n=1 Tax=Enterobacter cloacae TaxID=550 RepID=A0A377M8A9_ENTCL|nr:ribose operon repressor [Enterobacter cloacae]